MAYGKAAITVMFADTSDYADPLVRFLTSGYTLPSTTSEFMPFRGSAASGGMTIFTSALTSGFSMAIANRGTAGALRVSCTTSDGACLFPVPSGEFGHLPQILTASNVAISGTSGAAAVPFEFLLLGI